MHQTGFSFITWHRSSVFSHPLPTVLLIFLYHENSMVISSFLFDYFFWRVLIYLSRKAQDKMTFLWQILPGFAVRAAWIMSTECALCLAEELHCLKKWNASWICMSSLYKDHATICLILLILAYVLPKWVWEGIEIVIYLFFFLSCK